MRNDLRKYIYDYQPCFLLSDGNLDNYTSPRESVLIIYQIESVDESYMVKVHDLKTGRERPLEFGDILMIHDRSFLVDSEEYGILFPKSMGRLSLSLIASQGIEILVFRNKGKIAY